MNCPHCESDRTDIIDTRTSGEHERRRRRCKECGFRFTTYELTKTEYERFLAERKALEAIMQGVKQVTKARKDDGE